MKPTLPKLDDRMIKQAESICWQWALARMKQREIAAIYGVSAPVICQTILWYCATNYPEWEMDNGYFPADGDRKRLLSSVLLAA